MVKFSFIFSQSNANKMIWLGPIEVPFITTVDRNLFKKDRLLYKSITMQKLPWLNNAI